MSLRRSRLRSGSMAIVGAAFVLFLAVLAPSAHAAQQRFVLNLRGTGDGWVTSEPAGIDCGIGFYEEEDTECDTVFESGTYFVLTAHSDEHSTFEGFTGVHHSNCSGRTQTCIGTVEGPTEGDTRPTEIDAKFTGGAYPLKVTVTVAGEGEGYVTAYGPTFPEGIFCGPANGTCGQSFPGGETVTLEEEPSEGFEFTGWTGDCGGTAETCPLTMSANHSATATFAKVAEKPKAEHHDETPVTTPPTTTPVVTPTTPVAAVPPPPSNAFHLGKAVVNKRNGTARVKVVLPGPGQVTLKGKRVKTFSKKVATSGPVILPIEPTGSSASELRRAGSFATTVKVTFKPKGGTARTVPLKVKLLRSD
jgi:uncharacterized repeat protein (TIGR02543 family)